MPSLNPALRPFWKTKADIKILKGGRASSKTWDTAGMAVFLASKYTLKFLCVRQLQSRIAQSVYAAIKTQAERFGIADEFEFLLSVIRHKKTGSEFYFYGIHRHVEEIKGFEGADILWIEEGEGLTKDQWDILDPTIRKEGSEIWILYNPDLVSNFVEKFKHDPGKGVLVRHINYDENPFLSSTMLRKIERLKEEDYEEYEHIYLGMPRTDDDQVIIKRSWIMAAIDAHVALGIEPKGAKRIGFDVADSGNDKCSMVYTHGIVSMWKESWKGKEDELLKSCTRVYNKAIELGAEIDYDSIGVGAGAGSKFDDLNKQRDEQGLAGRVKYRKFIANAKAVNPDAYYVDTEHEKIKNKDFFDSLKSQSWWLDADRLRNTYNAVTKREEFDECELLSISSDMPGLEDLIDQLTIIKRDFDSTGRVKVESKKDLAKRGVESPNDADAFIMSTCPIEVKVILTPLVF